MGASGWGYYVPYQEDLDAARQQLRREVFEAGDYYWVNGADWRPGEEREPRPQTLKELWEDELVQEAGTHSILDIFRVMGPDDTPDYNTVEPVTAEEARELLETDKLTRAHVKDFDVFPGRDGSGDARFCTTTRASPKRSISGATRVTEAPGNRDGA
ncbi:hypothetical protein [Streptomyces sp. HC307]|uniref:hypothetical protein n=1 Tax=Streptomyces flavusporus TaxID=3385496 RepID=UPI0039171415